ncbi:unnamed protein product [Leptosia nina]|uniref:Uncharacterized protein n=1 Tax=Leptosia nina TaxID=320188 RepID=A0AAV1ITT8_9NEOP
MLKHILKNRIEFNSAIPTVHANTYEGIWYCSSKSISISICVSIVNHDSYAQVLYSLQIRLFNNAVESISSVKRSYHVMEHSMAVEPHASSRNVAECNPTPPERRKVGYCTEHA